uniref:Uncharacterized protein n=1 Tax=Hemiselmis andersenii TaxID=464988 RepID=A0A6U2FKF5_HEMAN|mmetsp:Transcript_32561/g.76020  ORF Transcript_32561/g.76020 Transcript_32561/m.76020 type:complete len:473 (+) Transcript_32561:19-1437(+)
MPLTSKPMEEEVAHSPRLYAFPFRSSADRFKQKEMEKESTHLFYEINTYDTSTKIKESPRKLAHIFHKPSEAGVAAPGSVDVPVYNTDCGPNKTLTSNMLESPRRFAFNYTAKRFNHKPREVVDTVYEVNTLHKAGMERLIAESPRKYSQMRSKVARDDGMLKEVHADYTPRNYEMQHLLEKDPKRYAIMNSQVPRDKGMFRELNPAVYNTEVLHLAGVATEAQRKPGCASTFQRTPRKPMNFTTDAPDKVYNSEVGKHASMYKDILESPRRYSNMAHSGRSDPPGTQNIAKDLLYQTEDVPVKPTLAFSIKRTPLLYSQMASSTPRFREEESSNNQAVYDLDSFPRGEGSIAKRVMESPRRYFGAQSHTDRGMASQNVGQQQLVYNPQIGRSGDTMTMEETIKRTPLSYANIRSVIPRFKAEKKAATTDEFEQLLRNPDRIDLKFQIRGNIVVKKTSDRAQLVVGRQAPTA